jgi:hypothetical protein
MNKPWPEELGDQLAHFAVAFALVALFALVVPVWIAAILSAAVGLGREIYQRLRESRKWNDFGPASRLDLLIWGIGSIAGAALWI